jgi:hypothetical protein
MVRRIRLELPNDRARSLDLESLPQWVQYHCSVTYDAAEHTVKVRAIDAGMYMMSTVNPALMRAY